MYYFVLYLMGVLLVFASCIHIYANVLGKEKPKFYATESSSDSLYEELVAALNKTEKRCKYYKIAYYTLNFVNVIGGVSISTVYINSTFSYCMGFAGFFVLISSLFILFLRPEENLYWTKNEITFLKKTRNKYDSMSDKNKAPDFITLPCHQIA